MAGDTCASMARDMRVVVCLAWLLLAVGAGRMAAQTVITDQFQWDQPGSSLAQVQAYRYEAQIDGGAPLVLAGVTCTGAASPFVCLAPIPAITPGPHTAAIRAVDLTVPTSPLMSAFSAPLSFVMRAVPATPRNLTVSPGSGG